MKLVSEELREKFGDIRFEVLSQDELHRASCIRRAADGVVLSYHIVEFYPAGIEALGSIHEKIVGGGALGEVIKRSLVPHERSVSQRERAPITPELAALFASRARFCDTETIRYRIRGKPYARIQEFYNPEHV